MTDFVKVAQTSEISPGQARLVDVKGKQIALFNINGEYFAIDNMCTTIRLPWPRERSRATR